jgi:hypothetical protein
MEQRLKAGLFSLHGVELTPINAVLRLGRSSLRTAQTLARQPVWRRSVVCVETESLVRPNIRLHRPPAARGEPTRQAASQLLRGAQLESLVSWSR